LEKLVKGFGE
jgi:hypothetical protein